MFPLTFVFMLFPTGTMPRARRESIPVNHYITGGCHKFRTWFPLEDKIVFCIIKISAFKKIAEIRSGPGFAPGMAFFIAAASVSHLDIDLHK